MILWFTGMSGSGKTVYADYLKKKYGYIVIDGDEIRSGMNKDLGFTLVDKLEHGRRMIELSKLLSQYGNICVSTITGDPEGRNFVLDQFKDYDLHFVWIKASHETCKKRDPKGLYKNPPKYLIGKDIAWEDPKNYSFCLDTEKYSITECYSQIDSFIKEKKLKNKIVAIDFDGTISKFNGWAGKYNYGSMISDASKYMNLLKDSGWKIIIYTTRNEDETVKKYLNKYDIPFDFINENPYQPFGSNPNKLYFDIILDDRAINFKGSWADAYKKIIDFKTYYE